MDCLDELLISQVVTCREQMTRLEWWETTSLILNAMPLTRQQERIGQIAELTTDLSIKHYGCDMTLEASLSWLETCLLRVREAL